MSDDWMTQGACYGMDANTFFPSSQGGIVLEIRDAKKVCARCDVREECLRYALEHCERHGVWGGKSERERRTLRREYRATPKWGI